MLVLIFVFLVGNLCRFVLFFVFRKLLTAGFQVFEVVRVGNNPTFWILAKRIKLIVWVWVEEGRSMTRKHQVCNGTKKLLSCWQPAAAEGQMGSAPAECDHSFQREGNFFVRQGGWNVSWQKRFVRRGGRPSLSFSLSLALALMRAVSLRSTHSIAIDVLCTPDLDQAVM